MKQMNASAAAVLGALIGVATCGPVAVLHGATPAAPGGSEPTASSNADNGHYQFCVDGSGHYALIDTRTGAVWTTQANSGDWRRAMDPLAAK